MADERLQVKQFRYGSDNLGYLIYGQKSAMAIDGGAVDAMLEFINANGLQLDVVTQTHTHPDHMVGHQPLMDHTGAAHLDSHALSKANELVLEGRKIRVYQTPGHTKDSVVFYMADTLLTGDTLFNGNVGSCFSGGM
ncbi:MAG: hydroxyacylglutathione hydrolase, partial [Desulfobacterales bacterium]